MTSIERSHLTPGAQRDCASDIAPWRRGRTPLHIRQRTGMACRLVRVPFQRLPHFLRNYSASPFFQRPAAGRETWWVHSILDSASNTVYQWLVVDFTWLTKIASVPRVQPLILQSDPPAGGCRCCWKCQNPDSVPSLINNWMVVLNVLCIVGNGWSPS